MAEICDLAFMIRADQIRQTALAQLALAPHLEEGQELQTPDQAVDEFAAWLESRPAELDQDDNDRELFELLGVR